MRSSKLIQVVGCHAEGEVGDVIVGGVAPPPGETIWEQSRFIARDQALRNFVLNEPRGGVAGHFNLLCAAEESASADGGLDHHGARRHAANVRIECDLRRNWSCSRPPDHSNARAGTGAANPRAARRYLIEVVAHLSGTARPSRISVRNVPSFADRLDAKAWKSQDSAS